MDISNFQQIADMGFGTASGVAILYGVWKGLGWLEKIATNHMAHIQEGVESIASEMKELKESVKELAEHLKK